MMYTGYLVFLPGLPSSSQWCFGNWSDELGERKKCRPLLLLILFFLIHLWLVLFFLMTDITGYIPTVSF